jgi:hypothetical protein
MLTVSEHLDTIPRPPMSPTLHVVRVALRLIGRVTGNTSFIILKSDSALPDEQRVASCYGNYFVVALIFGSILHF